MVSGMFSASLQLPDALDTVIGAFPLRALADGLRTAYDPAAHGVAGRRPGRAARLDARWASRSPAASSAGPPDVPATRDPGPPDLAPDPLHTAEDPSRFRASTIGPPTTRGTCDEDRGGGGVERARPVHRHRAGPTGRQRGAHGPARRHARAGGQGGRRGHRRHHLRRHRPRLVPHRARRGGRGPRGDRLRRLRAGHRPALADRGARRRHVATDLRHQRHRRLVADLRRPSPSGRDGRARRLPLVGERLADRARGRGSAPTP